MTHDPILAEITQRLGKRLQRLAIVTLQREDWAQWQALDPAFEPDYDHYRGRMYAAAAQLKAAGVNTIEVVVRPEAFAEWARARGVDFGSGARSLYAVERSMQADKGHARARGPPGVVSPPNAPTCRLESAPR